MEIPACQSNGMISMHVAEQLNDRLWLLRCESVSAYTPVEVRRKVAIKG